MKIRTIKELLELILNYPQHFIGGLCIWISNLYIINIINLDERNLLLKYVENNKPSVLHKFIYAEGNFWWKYNKIEPRIKWIKKHIKLIKSKS